MRKRRKSKNNYLIILIPLAIILFFFLILKSGLLNIKQIDVVGDKLGCADEKQIKDYSKLSGQNFFTINSRNLSKVLKNKFICIKDVNLSKTFPDKATIKITSRKPVAILITLKTRVATPSAGDISDSSVIDNEGIVFSKEMGNLSLPKVFILEDPDIGFLQILDKIKTFGINIKESWVLDNNFMVISEAPVLEIIFDLESQMDIQLASLQLILDKAKIDTSELTFIDLRFDKPVVRFAPKKK